MEQIQMVGNPFIDIAHKGDEDILLDKNEIKKINDIAEEIVKKHIILFVAGEHGSGKSLIHKEIEKHIPNNFVKKELVFTIDLLNELKAMTEEKSIKKNLVVFIDKFELSDVINNEKLGEMMRIIIENSKAGVGYVISCVPQTVKRVFDISSEFEKYLKVYSTKPLTFDQTKKLIISRLNSVRKKPLDSIAPFTEEEIQNIWKASNGNPKMSLLLCASLYKSE